MTSDVLRLAESLLGRYTIEREIGRGGMATVYLARDLRHARQVAVKVLHPDLAAALGAERFLAEIRTTANLQHPHILPLHDSGDAGGLLFYVMPFVEGETLRARLEREGPLPIDDAVRIAREVLSALDYAHRHGVIHRDVKPENILLHDGSALVADFGIALAVQTAGGARMTQTGLSLGTPSYMSPEQAMGEKSVDARSDIYAVGAMTYEMLTGEPPFSGASVQAIVAKVMTERPTPPSIVRDTVAPHIEAAVLRALAKLPADRFASAKDFADALVDGSRMTSSTALPHVVAGRPATRARRALGFLPWALLAIAIVVAGWLARRPREGPMELQLARQLTFEGDVVGTAISADGTWIAYVSDDCFGTNYTCTKTLKVREVDGAQSLKLVTWAAIGSTMRWSPDGSTIAFVGAPDSLAASLWVIPRLGGAPQRAGPAPSAWAFTPDGRLVVAEGKMMLWLDAHTFARTDGAALPVGFAFSDLDVRADGKRIAATARVNGSRALLLLDARGGLLDSTTEYGSMRNEIRWDASQSAILITTAAPGVADNMRRIPVDGSRLRADRATLALGAVTGIESSIDAARTGRVVFAGGPTSYDVLVRRLDDPRAMWTSLAHSSSWVWANDVSPDGTSIAGSATDNVGENAYIFPLDRGARRMVTALRGVRDYPYWSADGRHLAYWVGSAAGALVEQVFTDAEGGRERRLAAGRASGRTKGWVGNDAVVIQQGNTFIVMDTLGRERRRVTVPDSLAPGTTIRVDAARGHAAFWSGASGSGASGAVVVADLNTGRVTPVLKVRTTMWVAGWGSDGSLFLATTASAQVTSAATPTTSALPARRELVLQRLAPGATTLTRVAELPSGCEIERGGLVVGGGGTIAACTVRRFSPDVWLADRAGRSGW